MANKSVGLLTIAFGADLRGFDRAMKQAQRKISKFGKNMQICISLLKFGEVVQI